jgi:hypothetical protein
MQSGATGVQDPLLGDVEREIRDLLGEAHLGVAPELVRGYPARHDLPFRRSTRRQKPCMPGVWDIPAPRG